MAPSVHILGDGGVEWFGMINTQESKVDADGIHIAPFSCFNFKYTVRLVSFLDETI